MTGILMGIALADAAREEGEADHDQHNGDTLNDPTDRVTQESPPLGPSPRHLRCQVLQRLHGLHQGSPHASSQTSHLSHETREKDIQP